MHTEPDIVFFLFILAQNHNFVMKCVVNINVERPQKGIIISSYLIVPLLLILLHMTCLLYWYGQNIIRGHV